MIFPVLETEDIVQVGDKTRLDAAKSFISKDEDEIQTVEICPDLPDGDAEAVVGGNTLDDSPNSYYDLQSSQQKSASEFIPTSTGAITKITLTMAKVGTPDAQLYLQIWTSNDAETGLREPVTLLGASDVINASDLTTGYVDIDFVFSTPIDVTKDVSYFVVMFLGSSSLSGSNYPKWKVQSSDSLVGVGGNYWNIGGAAWYSDGGYNGYLMTIYANLAGDYVDVTGNSSNDWFLDWVYSGASRDVTAAVRVTTDGDPTILTKTISVVTVADDYLFSSDQDLAAFEPDILKWVPQGRASFLNVHRTAQKKIIEALDESGVVDNLGVKLTKAAVIDVTEVKAWSRDMTLALIFAGLSNAIDDVFERKAKYYMGETSKRKGRAIIRLDLDGDGDVDHSSSTTEGVNFRSMEIIRR